jgi:hypothetical protein
MKRLFLAFSFTLFAQPWAYASSLWQDIDTRSQARSSTTSHRALTTDPHQLKNLLWNAPLKTSGLAGINIDLPLADGNFITVEVFYSPVLSDELAQQFPDIKTFSMIGVDNPSITGRLDFTSTGFHAMINTEEGVIYINPEANYTTATENTYRAFAKKQQAPSNTFICKTADHEKTSTDTGFSLKPAARTTSSRTFGSNLRTYRLALSATKQYSNAVAAGNVTNTYSEMVTAVNRVNTVFERDVNIFLQLVSGTSLIATSTSSFTDNDADALLEENQLWIDTKLGSINYDIGHIFSTGGGGLASVAATCDGDYKAQGVTGSSSPTTDTFYIDYVAHEIGHQMGASHTFNAGGSSSGACDTSNRQDHTFEYQTGSFTAFLAASAYEVGSGSTIMSYAGICSPQNLQNNSDAYFHARSIEQMREFVDGDIASTISWADGSICGTNSSTGDIAPSAEAGANYTIPGRTPFALTGSATDADSDPSTFIYTWEQYDLGNATTSLTAMHTDNGTGPLIRSRIGSNNPTRYIPTLPAILAGTLQANTGERLPTTDRTMKFKLTVRSGTYGVSQDDTTLTIDKDAGPFIVTAPTNSTSYNGFSLVNAAWNVANTTSAPVSCALVDIYFSNDGGNTFPTLLLDDTPNDGSAQIQLPNISTNQGRVKVICNNNIFFNISPNNLTIVPSLYYLTLSGDTSANEGNSGSSNIDFTLNLNQIAPSTITVSYSISGSGVNSANISDFNGSFPSGSISFSPGQTNKVISIPINGDEYVESDETFTLTLSNPIGATITSTTAIGTILNDDSGPTINIAGNSHEKNEGNSGLTSFTFTVTRSGTTTSSSSVDYNVSAYGANSASANDFEDAEFNNGTVDFLSGETSKSITVQVNGDKEKESNETFKVTINNPSGGNIQTDSTIGTIINDDSTAATSRKSSGGGSSSWLLISLLLASCYRKKSFRFMQIS